MTKPNPRPSPRLHQLLILLALAAGSALSVSMMAARILYTRQLTYAFMIWNLLLAWIPFGFAFLAYQAYERRGRPGLLTVLYGLFWLIFLPNAPYMLTDLAYIGVLDRAPLWYNLVLLVSFACNGLFLGFTSLYLMQEIVVRTWNRVAGWLFALASLGLSGYGIYLGRFQRWNSWDILTNPAALAADVLDHLLHPIAHRGTFAVSLLYAAVLACMYTILFALTRVPRETGLGQNA